MYNKRIMLIAGLVLGAMLCLISQFSLASEYPDIIELNDFGNIYEPVVFDHAMHVDMASCADCHHHTTGLPNTDEKCQPCHKGNDSSGTVTCAGCHRLYPGTAEKMRKLTGLNFYHADTAGLKRAYHMNCLGCHQEMDAPSGCEDCHPKKDDTDTVTRIGGN